MSQYRTNVQTSFLFTTYTINTLDIDPTIVNGDLASELQGWWMTSGCRVLPNSILDQKISMPCFPAQNSDEGSSWGQTWCHHPGTMQGRWGWQVSWQFPGLSEFWTLLQPVGEALLLLVLCSRVYLGTSTLHISAWKLYSTVYNAGRLPERISVLFILLWDSLFIRYTSKAQEVRYISYPGLILELLVGAQQKSLLPATVLDLSFLFSWWPCCQHAKGNFHKSPD